MDKERLYQYFLDGIAMVIAIYEICRTGRRQRSRKKF